MRFSYRYMAVFTGVIFLIAAVLTLLLFLTRPSKGFVRTEATVTHSELYESTANGKTTLRCRFFADYTADGKTYTDVELLRNVESRPEEFMSGQVIEACYDPAHPEVLRKDSSSMMIFGLVLTACSLAVSVFAFVMDSRKR